jgi:hypothetical protein
MKLKRLILGLDIWMICIIVCVIVGGSSVLLQTFAHVTSLEVFIVMTCSCIV